MTMQQQIRAVYADPQIDGMEELYQAIGSELIEGSDFDEAYARVMERGGTPAQTWIRFCVQCASRLKEPPPETEFLAGLEECCRRHAGV